MLISPEQEALIGRVFESYLTDHHHNDILQLLADTNEGTHHPVVVNAMTLFEANMEVGDYFNAYPTDVLAIFDKVLNRKAMELTDDGSSKHNGGSRKQERRMVCALHARITGLPVCPELTRDTIPRTRDVGHFLSVTGTVIRTSVAKVLEYERDYMCAKCHHVFTVQADVEQFYTFVPPVACPNPDSCNSYKFTCLSGGSEPDACRDYQEIKIQEQVQKLSVGSIPRSLVVILEDDLVDSCKSGDDVTVYGVMCLRWKPFYDGALCDAELVLKANNIEVNNQQATAALLIKDAQEEFQDFWNSYKHDPIAGRNQILLSLCPQVFGMYVIKLAVAMVLAGGVQRIDSSGTKIRGECHMLLVGDPGTGKSQFLKYAAKVMSRSVLTAGIGSTSAGLTVAAVKDGGDWHLEAGALVLADGGLCCIDEFNSIKEHDRISIHEAMEQQSISVAKAGIVCKLNTRTTILGATNPKGQYDPSEPLSLNVALASPLLSRFDLVLILLDTRNADWDRIISSFILEDRGLPNQSSTLWSMEKMKAYFSVIKRLQPLVSEEANCILTRYYQLQRRRDGGNAARTTIRMLESLSRLAEAHAKLMYRETVTIEDAVTAVSVMECSMQGGALLGNVNALFTSFPADPIKQYQTQCQILLEGLNLPLFLQKEMNRLARLQSDMSEASDPPTTYLKHQVSGTNSKTQCGDITSNLESGASVKNDLNCFSSTPSLSPDYTALSMITSLQENLNTKAISAGMDMSTVTKQSSSQSQEETLRKTDSALNWSVAPGFFETVTSVSEENIQGEKNENIKEISKRRESRKYEAHVEPLGSVSQEVSRSTAHSKNLGAKGFSQLELNQQQFDKEVGRRHGERVVFGDESQNVSDDIFFEANLSTDKDSSCVEEDKRYLTGTGQSSAVLKENMAAETETHTDLSGFMFQPKKMRPLVANCDIIASPEKQMKKRADAKKPVNHNESACTLGTASKQNQVGFISEVEENGSKRNTRFKSKELDNFSFSFRKDGACRGIVGRKDGSGDAPPCQTPSISTADDNNTNTFTYTPLSKPTTDRTALQSGRMKTNVASSTLDKLSRFSFICTDERTTAQTKKGNSTAKMGGTDFLRANSKVNKILNIDNHTVLGQKCQTEAPIDKSKSVSLPSATGCMSAEEKEQRMESPTETVSKCKVKHAEFSHTVNNINGVKPANDGSVNYQGTAGLKRDSFVSPQCSNSSGCKGLFTGLSLFGSAELNNDVLDTDWDQEV